MKYRILAIKFERTGTRSKLVKTELYRDDLPHALIARDNLNSLGWIARVTPTPELWTEELTCA